MKEFESSISFRGIENSLKEHLQQDPGYNNILRVSCAEHVRASSPKKLDDVSDLMLFKMDETQYALDYSYVSEALRYIG